MNVCHVVFQPDSLTYTVAKALTVAGHNVFVWVTDPLYDRIALSNIKRRLAATPGVAIIPKTQVGLPAVIDRLIVQVFPRPLQSLEDFDMLARRAYRITLVSAGDRSKRWRQAIKLQWLEARTAMAHARKIDRIAYKDGFHLLDLHGLFKSRRVIGFDVHSQFLHSAEAFRAIHARDWTPEAHRPILVNFLGSQDPDSRKGILDSVRELFLSARQGTGVSLTKKRMFWHEYSDEAQAPLGPEKFLDVLSTSDFTLCPPGYSLVTHRPLEALLRGSIPVLPAEHLDLYDIGLDDEVNCISVVDGRWHDAILKIGRMGEEQIVRMRRNIYSMLDKCLEYKTASERMLARLGIRSDVEERLTFVGSARSAE